MPDEKTPRNRCLANLRTMKPIYLDYAATTPVREEVRNAMTPLLSDEFGNPSSRHRWGRAAAALLVEARERTAAALGVEPSEVIFIRGGTESDNLAILGRAAVARQAGARPLVVISAVEHKAVLEAAESVANSGGECVILAVGADGTLDLEALQEALARRPAVVSVMWVNNEVGLVLPVPEVADMAREAGVVFHTDAVHGHAEREEFLYHACHDEVSILWIIVAYNHESIKYATLLIVSINHVPINYVA